MGSVRLRPNLGTVCSVVASIPEGGPKQLRCIPDLWRGDVYVPLSGGYPGVAENLLDDSDMHTLFHQQGRRCMASIMQSSGSNAGRSEDCLPLAPVIAAFDGTAGRGRED